MLKANLLPLGIGSVPFTDLNETFKYIFENYSNIPYWPQFPKLNNYENMYIQFSEGLPCVNINIEKASIYVDTSSPLLMEEIEKFYEASMNPDKLDYFKISEKFATGLYKFATKEISSKIVKGHITGPISFGLTITDENKKSIIYNTEFKDIIPTLIAKKAKWQENFLKNNLNLDDIIIFFDEPYMVSYGSAFFNLPEEDVIDIFNVCFNEIDGIAGIHCCGNTDWSLVLKTDVKIINFDAFGYLDNFLLYKNEIKKYLEKNNGYLAWGLIPTDDEKINSVSFNQLKEMFDKTVDTLTKAGIERELIFERSFITPSCGTGSMIPENAKKVLKLNRKLSDYLRESCLRL